MYITKGRTNTVEDHSASLKYQLISTKQEFTSLK